jgi:hypothetical protein
LLVAPIAVIGIVDKRLHAKSAGEDRGLVLAGIVDQNLDVYNVRQFLDGHLQSLLGVVRRHHNRYALSVDQRQTPATQFVKAGKIILTGEDSEPYAILNRESRTSAPYAGKLLGS